MINKLHTLCALILLTSCGGSPPVWNGEWERIDDDVEGKLTMKITDYDQYDASQKRVFMFYNGRIDARCRFKNAEESEVKLECKGEDPIFMVNKGDKIILNSEVYGVWNFVRTW